MSGAHESPHQEAVVAALIEHFARDHLPVEEFESRLDRAHSAVTREELAALLDDLPSLEATGLTSSHPGTSLSQGEGEHGPQRGELAPVSHQKQQDVIFSMWGNAVRTGAWRPARATTALVFQAGAELDFREALLPPGETRLTLVAIMGGIDILIPPGVRVEGRGVGLMGGWDQAGGEPPPGGWPPDHQVPVLRINGVAVMGGVGVEVRLPGESARDARRRKKGQKRLPGADR